MLKNHVLTALRHISKYKLFSFINIVGLSVGLATVMLITLYIWDEFTFDSYLNQNDGLYKLELQTNFPGRGVRNNPVTAGGAAIGLPADYPHLVAKAARISRSTRTVSLGDRNVSEEIVRADASFFEMFGLDFIEGDATNALRDLSSVALSRSAAIKYFGSSPALGQTLDLDDGKTYRVGAVYRDFPENTHIRPNLIFPMRPSDQDNVSHDEGWWSIGFFTYVQLQDGVTGDELRAVMPEFIDRYLEAQGPDEPMSDIYKLTVIPMARVHFETAARNAGDPVMLTGFAAIALLILSIATFNFMNMSISRTVVRAREVAVRKALGADRKNIIAQFMSETVVTVLLALFLALAITELSLPWFNAFVAKLMSTGILASPTFVIGIFALVGIVALGAGFFPASIMSNFRPAEVLGGGRSDSVGRSRFRTILVSIQFAVAIGLMIAATVVYQQIQYSQNMDPGYRKENVVLIAGLEHPSLQPSVQTLKQRLLDHPDIVNATLADQAPGGTYGWMEGIDRVNGKALPQSITIRGMLVDQDFAKTFGMKLVAGRMLSQDRADDFARRLGEEDYRSHYNILINETAARTLGLGSAREAIGKTFGEDDGYTIVGVIGDYLIGSSKGTVPPMYFMIDEQGFRGLALRLQTNNVSAVLQYIDQTWAEIAGDRPIRRQFLDERIARLYQVEQHQAEIFALFAGLAVLVSCVGLYGLASFSVAQRTKEIGLRKTFGASSGVITRHILWDFSKPVLIANLIAWPIAFYFMREWLTRFNYRIDLDLMPFMLAAILALAVAWITVGGQALRVARAKPVYALRYE